MRQIDWQRDIAEALRREDWSLSGPKAIVKIVPRQFKPHAAVTGYFTQGKFLVGKIASRIERDLGLPANHLAQGIYAYRFARLPLTHEIEYELTTKYPGGLYFNPSHSDARYLPGADHIHQWAIKEGFHVPVDPHTALELPPGTPFPYSWLV